MHKRELICFHSWRASCFFALRMWPHAVRSAEDRFTYIRPEKKNSESIRVEGKKLKWEMRCVSDNNKLQRLRNLIKASSWEVKKDWTRVSTGGRLKIEISFHETTPSISKELCFDPTISQEIQSSTSIKVQIASN